jgi:hypothetical protein
LRISGFSFVRNGLSLYYPVVESIQSILPICDEFVIAVGQGHEGDGTRDAIASLGSRKVRIIDTVWEERHFDRGASNAIQTDIAKAACSGDWLFYLQADEVLHEQYLAAVQRRCRELLPNDKVEGLLLRFRHFWGDYRHYVDSHAWYNAEIRIVRNLPQIHSWHSAQSFRYCYRYDNPWQTRDTRKLRVARADAEVFHYGWVRPPAVMQRKNRALRAVHAGRQTADSQYAEAPPEFDYGPLNRLPVFEGSHPASMAGMISRMDWQDQLRMEGPYRPGGERPKHDRLKYRLLTLLERCLFRGEQVCGSRNYRLVRV